MKKRERLYFIAHSFVFLRENRAADILLLSNLAMICFFSSFFIAYIQSRSSEQCLSDKLIEIGRRKSHHASFCKILWCVIIEVHLYSILKWSFRIEFFLKSIFKLIIRFFLKAFVRITDNKLFSYKSKSQVVMCDCRTLSYLADNLNYVD